MLAIDAISEANILPEHDVAIIDEAHELDGRITSVSTAEITTRAIKMAANRAKSLGNAGNLSDLAEEFDDLMKIQEPGRWTDLDETSQSHLRALAEEFLRVKSLVSRAPEGEATDDPEKNAERQNLSNHLSDLAQAVSRMLEVFATDDPAKQDDVVWLERDPRSDAETLAVAPLSIAHMLRENLFGEQTVVLTSATLALGGRFDAMAAQWGMPSGTYDTLDAGTPFDPAKSGILYTAKHLPAPGRDGLSKESIEEIYELIMAAGGRTLGLFSSRRAAEEAAAALKPRIPFDLFVQGEDSIGALVEKFSQKENSCLFGTLTLWQGVDVPGPACSLVIIDRIPFPRPDDPLMQARAQAADAAGRSGFMEVSANHAALLMAQGAGRLLRHVTDRGVVAVLDNRLEYKRYGSFLKASMPRFWQTTDASTVRGALKRLVAGRNQVFAAAPLAIRTRPHVVPGLGRNDHLVPIGCKVGAQEFAECALRGALCRTIIVGKVEVGDAEIKSGPRNFLFALVRGVIAEIVPKSQRNERQFQSGPTTAAVVHAGVTVGRCGPGHCVSIWPVFSKQHCFRMSMEGDAVFALKTGDVKYGLKC